MKISEEEARLRVGLAIATATCSNRSAAIPGADFVAAFNAAFERKETTETKTEGVRKFVKVYRELSKVDEIVNKSISENIVEGRVVVRRLISDKTEIIQQ